VIAQISGTLAHKIPGEVIVDVGGVGYQIFIPLNVFYQLPEIGASVRLQIYTHVRDDALQLFGFSDFAEKQVFLLLIGVSLVADGLGLHIPKGYIYFAMGFSVFVEMINLRVRRRVAPVQLRDPHRP